MSSRRIRLSAPRRALVAAIVLTMAVTALPAAAVSARASGDDVAGAAAPEANHPDERRNGGPARRVMDQPRHGEDAIEAIGDRMSDVARQNGRSVAELTRLLGEDPSIWIDSFGAAFYIDGELPGDATEAAASPSTSESSAPLADTFLLHSRAGADRTIFLDFDGHTVENTAWNDNYPTLATSHPAYDSDGTPSIFSDIERALIQDVWQRVAEDFAPFDVDVTTEDPGVAALERSSDADSTYGIRVLISPSSNASGAICGDQCGGIAYLGFFNYYQQWPEWPSHEYFEPAWVFPHLLGGSAKNIAEAASHEAGHNFNLDHDGQTSSAPSGAVGYYAGHGNWAPIMGTGYSMPISQWSRGEYEYADRSAQDDLAVIQAYGAPLRADDHGDHLAATELTGTDLTASGTITTAADVDAFAFTLPADGLVAMTATRAPVSANLDIRLGLRDASGSEITFDDPLSSTSFSWPEYEISGLDASLSENLPAGDYVLTVEGVGARDPLTTGYSDYASLGDYTVDVDFVGCSEIDVDEPNDDATAPHELFPTAWVPEGLLCPGDVDHYGVYAFEGDTLDAQLTHSAADGDLDLAVFGPDGSSLLGQSTTTADVELVTAVTVQDTGWQVLRVTGTVGSAGNGYDLDASTDGGCPPDDGYEPNDSVWIAEPPVNEGHPVYGRLCSGNTTDVFSFFAESGDVTTATIEYELDHGDLRLLWGMPSGSYAWNNLSSDVESITMTATTTGRHWIAVENDSTSGLGTGSNPLYRASVSTPNTPDPCPDDDAYEDNDALDVPTNLPAGLSIIGELCANDPDVYRFHATGGSVTADLDFTHAYGNLDLQLWDATGTTLVASSSTSTDDESITDTLVAGDYLVRVLGGGAHDQTGYGLTVTGAAEPITQGDNVYGSVEDFDGAPAEYAQITAYELDEFGVPTGSYQYSSADEFGEFAMTLTTGTWELEADDYEAGVYYTPSGTIAASTSSDPAPDRPAPARSRLGSAANSGTTSTTSSTPPVRVDEHGRVVAPTRDRYVEPDRAPVPTTRNSGTSVTMSGSEPSKAGTVSSPVTVEIDGSGAAITPMPITITLTEPQLWGHLYEPDGATGVPDFWVDLYSWDSGSSDWAYNTSAGTNASGTFGFADLPDGDYRIVAESYDATRATGFTDVEINGGTPTTVNPNDVTFGAPAIGGVVYEPGGSTGAAYASVEVYLNDGFGGPGDSYTGTGTNESGGFGLDLPDGDYVAQGLPPYDTTFAPSPIVAFTVLGGETAPLSLTLRSPNVYGTVFASDETTPESYAYVTVFDEAGENELDYAAATSNGEFGLFLPDGNYNLRAWPASGSTDVESALRPITVSGSGTANPYAINLRSPNVDGTVFLPDGSTAVTSNDAYVRVFDVSGEPTWVKDAYPDDNGDYVVFLEDGSYELQAIPSDTTLHASSERAAVTVASEIATPSTVDLTLRDLNVTGSVFEPGTTTLVPGALVDVYTNDGMDIVESVWAELGEYALFLEDGAYELVARAPEGSDFGASDPKSITVTDGVPFPANPNDLVLREATLSGVVYDPTGFQPQAEAFVDLYEDLGSGEVGDWVATAETDINGAFRFFEAAGDYLLLAWPPYGTTYGDSGYEPVTITGTGTVQQNLLLRAPTITGTVYSSTDVATADASVTVRDAITGEHVAFATSTSTGQYGLVVEDGDYTIYATPPYLSGDAQSEPYGISVTSGVPTPGNPNDLHLLAPNVSGVVYQPGGSTPIDMVVAEITASQSGDDPLTVTSDLSGNYSMSLPDGTFDLVARAPGYGASDPVSVTIFEGTAAPTPPIALVLQEMVCPDIAGAIDIDGIIVSESWVECSAEDANGVTALQPTVVLPSADDRALMASGSVGNAEAPNDSTGTSRDNRTTVRGANDVSIKQLDLNVPTGRNCLSFEVAFGSEEYPEFVGSFNDGFLAELGSSNWALDGNTITAPNNFAVDGEGNLIAVNEAFSEVIADNGTEYDGMTQLLRVRTPISEGAQTLFLSIFDAGDHVYDSGAFIDNLITTTEDPGNCDSGVVVDSCAPLVDDAREEDDDYTQATLIESGQEITDGVLCDEADWFKIEAAAGETVTANLTWEPGSEMTLTLYDTDGVTPLDEATSTTGNSSVSRAMGIGGVRSVGITGSGGSAYTVEVVVRPSNRMDYDGDGVVDVAVFRPSEGKWYFRQAGDGWTSFRFGLNGDVPVPADYDGDGVVDVAVFRPSEGKWYFRQAGDGWTSFRFGLNGDVPVPADYDGDGVVDVAVFRPSEGKWYFRQAGDGWTSFRFGLNGDVPVPADYDGDGVVDVAVFRPSEGKWYFRQAGDGWTSFRFGLNGDVPVPADYDGDGVVDVAVFRPSEGKWYFRQAGDGWTSFRFGLNGDVPVPADYDGDGVVDVAVFRPSEGKWYFRQAGDGWTSFRFGLNGDVPLS